MRLNIIDALKVKRSKKVFFIYIEENREIKKFILSNDLTRFRLAFGIKTKFILTDILKKQINNINIKL